MMPVSATAAATVAATTTTTTGDIGGDTTTMTLRRAAWPLPSAVDVLIAVDTAEAVSGCAENKDTLKLIAVDDRPSFE